MGEWARASVSELQQCGILHVEDGNHGEYRPRKDEFVQSGTCFIRAADMEHGRVLFETASQINSTALERIRKGIGAGGDVLLSHKGTVGKVAYVPFDSAPFVCSPQTTFWRALDESRLDRRFLYYFLCSTEFQRQLFARKAETDMADYVSLTNQRGLFVTLPSIDEQRAIAHVLGTLDDKIQLNRRMNETLEAVARALFKSWFVDFDPVRAKAEGRETGLPGDVADLFPDRFEDSELGEIPAGWEPQSIYKVAEVRYGAPFKSDLFNATGAGLPLIRIRDLASHDPQVYTSEENPRGFGVAAGDVIVGMDGEFRAHSWHGPDALLNQRLCQFMSKEGVPLSFLRLSIEEPLDFFERSKTGTTVIHLGKRDIDTFRILVPDHQVLCGFAALTESLGVRALAAAKESRLLAKIRMALLPRLLSRELRTVTV